MNKQFFSQNSPINNDDMIVIKLKRDTTSGDPEIDMTTSELQQVYNTIHNKQIIPVFCYYKQLKQTAGRPYDTLLIPCVVKDLAPSQSVPTIEDNMISIEARFKLLVTGGTETDYNITINKDGTSQITALG